MDETKLFAVAGSPILHSRSPAMFGRAFAAAGMNAAYIRLAMRNAEETARTIRDLNILGTNITSPFKEDIIPFLDAIDGNAAAIGAVNTIVNNRGRLTGYNTDHEGIGKALMINGMNGKGRKAVVIGAGGAARAAVFACTRTGLDTVIVNRTFEKARRIADGFCCRARPLEELGDEIETGSTVILCVPAAGVLTGQVLSKEGLAVIDARYGKKAKTGFAGKGAKLADGLTWLLFQGAAAFRIFTGCEPDITEMEKALRGKERRRRDTVSITGFMGAGKSTVGAAVAKRLSVAYVDVDSAIEKKTGRPIGDTFRDHGEAAFREHEKEEVKLALGLSPCVMAVGGGAVLDGESAGNMKTSSLVVWLYAGRDETLLRIAGDGARPMAAGKEDMTMLFKDRIPAYARTSHMLIRTDTASVDEVVERIVDESYKAFGN